MMKCNILFAVLLLASSLSPISAGPFALAICYTGCNALAVACYAAGGFTMGTVTAGVGIPAAIVACNTALGVCMTACVAAAVAPVP